MRQKRKCAFCDDDAVDHGGEHLWDDWINEEATRKMRFDAKKRLSSNSKPIQFVTVGLREKLPVVCSECNQGWMSALTAKFKSRFSGSVLNASPFSLSKEDAALLATFIFMKAAVKDYCYGEPPFFTRDARRHFKASSVLPPLARMWFAAYQGSALRSFVSNFYLVRRNTPGPHFGMEFFCYTYILGNLAFQLVAPRWKHVGIRSQHLVALVPNRYWQPAAIQFWPYDREVHWPPEKFLGDDVIEHFINRFDAPINFPI